jgi:hypothetical protein
MRDRGRDGRMGSAGGEQKDEEERKGRKMALFKFFA